MKRGKKLLILLACLAVVCLAAWGISALFAPDTTGTPMNSSEVIFTLEGIKTLSWQYEENTVSFDVSGDSWVYTQDASYRIDETKKADILEQLTELKAQKIIEDPGAPADYGLDAPVCTITADDTVIQVGDVNALSSYRYLSLGDGKVYMVTDTFLSPFTYSLLKMAQLEELPDLSAITALTITTETQTMTLVSDPADHSDYTDSYSWYMQEADGYSRVSQEVVEGLLVYLEDLRWLSCADINLQEPATYGLDVPAATYEIAYTMGDSTGTLTLLVGDSNEEGVFVKPGDSNRVYLVEQIVGQVMAQMSTETLYCTDVIRIDQDGLKCIEILLNGKTYLIEKTTMTGVDDGGSTGWGLGDRQVEITDLLDSLNALAAQDGSDLTADGLTEELKLIFHRESDSLALTFYRYDGTYCLSVLNGEAPQLAPRTDVVDIIEQINAFVLN